MKRALAALLVTFAASLVTFAAGCELAFPLHVTEEHPDAAAAVDAAPGVDAAIDADAALDASFDAAGDPHLVGEWRFEEAAGTTASDTSGRGHDGTLVGGAAFTTDGKRGGAVTMHGTSDQWVEVPSLKGAAFPQTGTLSIWYRAPAFTSAQAAIFDYYDSARNHLYIRHPNGYPPNRIQFALQSTTSVDGFAFVVDTDVSVAAWIHLVATWSAAVSTAAFYIDGVLQKRAAYEVTFVPKDQSFQLGIGLAGSIDEVRLYDVALDDAAATALDRGL